MIPTSIVPCAGQAAMLAGIHDKAQYYFNKLIQMAGLGDNRPEMEQLLGLSQ